MCGRNKYSKHGGEEMKIFDPLRIPVDEFSDNAIMKYQKQVFDYTNRYGETAMGTINGIIIQVIPR